MALGEEGDAVDGCFTEGLGERIRVELGAYADDIGAGVEIQMDHSVCKNGGCIAHSMHPFACAVSVIGIREGRTWCRSPAAGYHPKQLINML
jgi:hypothetical protein